VAAQPGPPFTDDPLQAGVTTVRALHVLELRQAVNNVRLAAGLPPAEWADLALTSDSTPLQAAHVIELRTRLDEALAALRYAIRAYTDPALAADATTIRAVHIQELRDRLKRLPPICASSLSPSSLTLASGGGSADLTISAAEGCEWAAGANVEWITFLDAPSGTGRAHVGFSVAANPTTRDRSGAIALAGQVVTVSQPAGSRSIVITHPASGSTYGSGEPLTLSAAVDSASRASRVDFLVDGIPVGTAFGPPFASPWTTGSGGATHEISAIAMDAIGGPASSGTALVAIVNCPAIDPTDESPDDAGLQCRLDRGGTIELRAGSPGYIVNGSPKDGYAHGRGVYVTRHGTHLTTGPGGVDPFARIVAGPDLWGDLLRTDPAMDATGVHDVEIDHIIFDGRVDVLVGAGQPLRRHRDGCAERGSGNLTLNVHGLRFHDNQTTSAMCGSGLQLIGMPNDEEIPPFPFALARNYIGANGRDYKQLGVGPRWSDGMTLLWCDRGTIVNNLFVDNTDIDLTVGGSHDCTVAFNTIAHLQKYGYTGLNIGSALGGTRGDHAGSQFTDNTIYTGRADGPAEPHACLPYGTPDSGLIEDQLSVGILVGTHPWDSTLWVTNGGTVARNKSHHNVVNLVVDGVCAGAPRGDGTCPSSTPQGVRIEDNRPWCPRGTLGKGQCRAGGRNFTVNPDHIGSATGWQPGYESLWYDRDTCSISGPVP
jgi:hypothetical protein